MDLSIESIESKLENLGRDYLNLKRTLKTLKQQVSDHQLRSASSTTINLSDESPDNQNPEDNRNNLSTPIIKQHVYASTSKNMQGIQIHSDHILTPPYSIESTNMDIGMNNELQNSLQSTPSLPELQENYSIPEKRIVLKYPDRIVTLNHNNSNDPKIQSTIMEIPQTVQTIYNDGVVELYRNDDFNSCPSQVEELNNVNTLDSHQNENMLNSALPDINDNKLDNVNLRGQQQDQMSENQSLFGHDETVDNVLPNSFDMNDFLNFCNDIPCEAGQQDVDEILHPKVENPNCQKCNGPAEIATGDLNSGQVDKMFVSSTSNGAIAQLKVQETLAPKSMSESNVTQNSVIEFPIETDGLRPLSRALDIILDRIPSVVIANQTKEATNSESFKEVQGSNNAQVFSPDPINSVDTAILPPPGQNDPTSPMNSGGMNSPAFSPDQNSSAGPMNSPVPVTSTSDIPPVILSNTAPVTFGRITKHRKTIDCVRSYENRGRPPKRKQPTNAENKTKTNVTISTEITETTTAKENGSNGEQNITRRYTRRHSCFVETDSTPHHLKNELARLKIPTPPPKRAKLETKPIEPKNLRKLFANKSTQTILKMRDLEGIVPVVKEKPKQSKKSKSKGNRGRKRKRFNKKKKMAMIITDDFKKRKYVHEDLKELKVVVEKEEVTQSDIEEFKRSFLN